MPTLLFCLEGTASVEQARACHEHFRGSQQRDWSYRPVVVDQIDEVPVTSPDHLPELRTVGVAIELPEPGDAHADEDAIRRDVSALAPSVSDLAERAGLEFVVEYREEAIGFLDAHTGADEFVAAFFGDARS